MLARFAARREGRLALVLATGLSLTGCGGFSKMQDILTDKPANGQQQKPDAPAKSGAAQQPAAATPLPGPLTLPPAQ